MKAAAFDYIRADTVEEACRLLAEGEGEARIIAGGQTLVPLMAMRLARPELLVDINRIASLKGVTADGETLVIGAGTRQADVLADAEVAARAPLLAEALSHVGHEQTRNRGTVGGSLANADPTAEIGLVARTLDAEIVARSSGGERRIPAAAFFESAMVTTLAPEELLIALRLPVWTAPRTGHGFHELGIRHGDFAIAAAAAQLTLDSNGRCIRIHVGVGGASPCPVRLTAVEDALAGSPLDDAAIARATEDISDMLDPESDIHAGAEQRQRTARAMARRAIADARDRAQAGAA
ncbi:MAG: xanthine dehydrogenase family protein subunit M [Alphaproteobacteria bacterium]|nr:xanthine dehydrogenase family protein subunit M [Alphaproteobacteria bacterium]